MGYSISGGFLTKTKAYSGRCHCGAVVDEVQADLAQVTSCNCSIFRKKGHLLSFVLAEAFVLRSGEDSLQDHRSTRRSSTTCSAAPAGFSPSPAARRRTARRRWP